MKSAHEVKSAIEMTTTGLTANPFILIGGSFAFAVGLAWNDLITAVINDYYSADKSIKAKAIYCIILTIVIVIITITLNYLNIKSQQINQELQEKHKIQEDAKKYSENFHRGF